jgi:bifunctional non-homologous end joining protein LigD
VSSRFRQQAPSGPEWLHEIRHEGFRVIARKDGNRVKLYSRPDNDLTDKAFESVSSMRWYKVPTLYILTRRHRP